jgi:hypothetical protein
LNELSIFQWNGTGVGATRAQYVTNKEWNYSMLYLYMNMVKVKPYFEKFNKTYWTSRVQPTLKQLDHMSEHGLNGGPSFLKWFRQHVIYLIILFSFLYLLHQSSKMCNVVYSFICSVFKMSMSPMT